MDKLEYDKFTTKELSDMQTELIKSIAITFDKNLLNELCQRYFEIDRVISKRHKETIKLLESDEVLKEKIDGKEHKIKCDED